MDMKKYDVTFNEICTGLVEVMAESEEEAKEKAYEMWCSGKAPADGDIVYDFASIKEA